MTTNLDEKTKSCQFDEKDGCHALACYSGESCGSRDEKGYPRYILTKQLKEELKKQREVYKKLK